MSTASPWYASGTLWTAAGTVVAVVAIAVAVLLWRLGYPRRSIMWYTPVVTSLLSRPTSEFSGGNVKVSFNDKPLDDPYLVTLVVESLSRRDIANRDFNNDQPLIFRLGVTFVTSIDDAATRIDADVVIEQDAIKVGPCLIRKGVVARLQVLTEGPPDITTENPLIDVDVWNMPTSIRPNRLAKVLMSSTLYFPLALLIYFVAAPKADQSVSVPIIFAALIIIGMSMGWTFYILKIRKTKYRG